MLVNNIEDRPDNATRFLVVGRNLLAASGDDKTTILVSTADTAGGAGVLHALLKPLALPAFFSTRTVWPFCRMTSTPPGDNDTRFSSALISFRTPTIMTTSYG